MSGSGSDEPQESEGAWPGTRGRVLVTGATGLLGRSVCRQLRDDGWSVIATGFSRASPRMHRCDLTSEEQVHDLVQTHKPEVIVHCAAERRPDVVERSFDSALNLNVHATAVLAKEAASCGSFLLYISTDYVFDGGNPPYGEDDAPNPLNLYGRSKMEGERETRRHCPDSAVLRVPVLFGEVEQVGESAVTALWTSVLDSSRTCSVDHVQPRYPTDVRDVARVCSHICAWHQGVLDAAARPPVTTVSDLTRLTPYHGVKLMLAGVCSVEEVVQAVGQEVDLLNIRAASHMDGAIVLYLSSVAKVEEAVEKGAVIQGVHRAVLPMKPPPRGVFHFSGQEQMTKYEMAKAIADAFNLPSDHIVPSTDSAPGSASRPHDVRLACSRFEHFELELRPFKAAILDCLWPFTPERRRHQTVFH